MVPIAKPLREHIETLPIGDQPGCPIHPKAYAVINRQGRSGNLSRLLVSGLQDGLPIAGNGAIAVDTDGENSISP
jgi:hypothetical protein